jgi:hypothetical protein
LSVSCSYGAGASDTFREFSGKLALGKARANL